MNTSRRIFWSLRREFWENRSLTIAPLAAAAVLLIGFGFSAWNLPEKVRAAAGFDPMKMRAALVFPYDAAAGLLMLTGMAVAIFYCLDALYGERRDRSILFWKSLPVSDLTTVLVKASIPLIILPLLFAAVILATQFVMLIVSTLILAISGVSSAPLWQMLAPPRAAMLLLYHMVTVHGLWQAPLYGWLLLVSAWARKTPFLWAFLPPVAIAFFEKIALGTTHFLSLLWNRVGGGMEAMVAAGTFPTAPMTHLTPLRFLSSPGLWIGLAVTAALLAGAIRLRRRHGAM